MKPHEETWTAHGDSLQTDDVFIARFQDPAYPPMKVDIERARLAAQAPAMARFLLHQLEYGDEGNETLIRNILRAAGVIP